MSYLSWKTLHLSMAALTIGGFVLRTFWMATDSLLLQARLTKVAPHVIDTVFLASGVALVVIAGLDIREQPWLLAKFAGLIAYIVLGAVGLRYGRSKPVRLAAAIMALLVFTYIAGVAVHKTPASWFG